jgi:predicted regulator of Ras-like GTPase activity (Roadblock/LC7/MglB family)
MPFAPPPPVSNPPAPIIPISSARSATGPMAAPAGSGPLHAPLSAPSFGPAAPAALLTLSQGTDLRALLGTIDRAPGVAGSLLVGHDGLTIISSLPPEIDREFLGAQASSVFTGNDGQMRKLNRGELRRMVLETEQGVMLMTAADMGILVVVSQDGQAMDVGAVTAAISGALGRP